MNKFKINTNRNLQTIFLLIWFVNSVYAQKNDNIWPMGGWNGWENSSDCEKPYCLTLIDFTQNETAINWLGCKGYFTRCISSICNDNGSLKYMSNGFTVFNEIGDTVINGDSISPGSYYKYNNKYYNYYFPTMFLPLPSENESYILFHSSVPYSDSLVANLYNFPDSLCFYSKIKNGVVTDKNYPIISENTSTASWGAVKHANGRDWWVLKFAEDPKYIWRILLTPKGITEVVKVELNYNPGFDRSYGSLLKFSGLGNKLVANFFSTPQALFECDFDRCNGSFSGEKITNLLDFVKINHPRYDDLINPQNPNLKPEYLIFPGIELSPNGHFLYYSLYNKIFQFDLLQPNWEETPFKVAEILNPDPSDSIFYEFDDITLFTFMQKSPDDKIYVNHATFNTAISVIDNPNLAGALCNFKFRQQPLYSYTTEGLVSFPNFRLGPVDGSICDSLGLTNTYNPEAPEKPTNPLAPFEIKIYPNPNNGLLTIGINQEGNYLLKVYNAIGQLVAQSSLGLGTTTINLQSKNVSAGLYFVEISNEQQQRLKIEKVVVASE